ncbi:MAG: nucleotidyltransferase family protein [Trueperaceae bacterium]
MDAIVLAGGRLPPEDPTSATVPGGLTCLQVVGGRTLVQRSLDALSNARGIERVIVVGVPSETPLTCAHPLETMPAERDMIRSLQAAVARLTATGPNAATPPGAQALVVSADAPLVTGEMLDWMRDRALEGGADATICAVERAVMEARFPSSKRTFVRLRDAELCGGHVAAFRLAIVDRGVELAERLVNARKNPWQIAALVGPGTLAALMAGRLTLAQALRALEARIGLRLNVLVSPYAEMAMDVDEPAQLALVRAELEARG